MTTLLTIKLTGLSSATEDHEDFKRLDICGRRPKLPILCDIRWLARVDSISTLLSHIEDMFDALEEIKSALTV